MRIIITGGAGFIGSAMIRFLVDKTDHDILNIDLLTYAGNLSNLNDIEISKNYSFLKGDIADAIFVKEVFSNFQPDAIINFAAESHVDRSIDGPKQFIQTNILGTFTLLEESRRYLENHPKTRKNFRFMHISTDEVYGDLELNDSPFKEDNKYLPSSPYSSSKASSDHLVRAWNRTFEMPTLITNCSNNYGPFQFPEKLIPLVILNALDHKPIPIYGDGSQIRDWLFVDDHVKGIYSVLTKGTIGETYNIGGSNEFTNLSVVNLICEILDDLKPINSKKYRKYSELITFVADRAGHDKRYAIDSSKIAENLNWSPEETFSSGLKRTVEWYIKNIPWCESVMDGKYNLERLGKI